METRKEQKERRRQEIIYAALELFVPIIEWDQQEGTIRAGEPRVISNAFWCSVQGIAERYATNQEIDLPEADWIVDIVRKR